VDGQNVIVPELRERAQSPQFADGHVRVVTRHELQCNDAAAGGSRFPDRREAAATA